jgi:hypothetical protein
VTRRFVLATVLALGVLAAPAHAGSYAVSACGSYGNHSWDGVTATDIARDEGCNGSDPMGNRVGGAARVPLGAAGTTTFTAPSGMTIADFTLTRQLTYRNGTPADGTRPLYALYKLGGTVFAGAGRYENATRARLHDQGAWYGYPENNVVVPKSTVSRASFPALAGYAGDATTLQIAVGCYNGSINTACTTAAGGGISHLLSSPVQVVLNDPTLPVSSIEASGLLAGGRRAGSDAVTLDASDNGGIRRVEIVDVTGGARTLVGVEDYAAGARTASGDTCSFRLRKACPNLRNETVRPSQLGAGVKQLKLRIVDAGGNAVERGPYQVDVATPSDRGPLNGSDATEDGSLSAHFSGGNARKTVGYRSRVRVSGRLLNASRRPVSGATLRVLTRDRRSSARFVQRWTATTRSDGSYSVKVRAAASRLVQVAWHSHERDPSPQENAYVTLNARASASLHARPRVVRVGRSLRLSGTVRGVIPSRGVPLIFQGRGGGGRYTTFADGRADRSGRFSIRYRFRNGSSRGRTFSFRVKLRGDARFPYALGYSRRMLVRVR